MMLGQFWILCTLSEPGQIITHQGKRWRVAWKLSEGEKLAIGLEPLSASAERTPNPQPAADAAGLQRKDK